MFTFFLNVGMEGMFLLEVDYNATQHNTTKSSSIKRTILDLLVHVLDSSHNHDAICNTTLEQKMKSIPTEERKNMHALYIRKLYHTRASFTFSSTIQIIISRATFRFQDDYTRTTG